MHLSASILSFNAMKQIVLHSFDVTQQVRKEVLVHAFEYIWLTWLHLQLDKANTRWLRVKREQCWALLFSVLT